MSPSFRLFITCRAWREQSRHLHYSEAVIWDNERQSALVIIVSWSLGFKAVAWETFLALMMVQSPEKPWRRGSVKYSWELRDKISSRGFQKHGMVTLAKLVSLGLFYLDGIKTSEIYNKETLYFTPRSAQPSPCVGMAGDNGVWNEQVLSPNPGAVHCHVRKTRPTRTGFSGWGMSGRGGGGCERAGEEHRHWSMKTDGVLLVLEGFKAFRVNWTRKSRWRDVHTTPYAFNKGKAGVGRQGASGPAGKPCMGAVPSQGAGERTPKI